MQIADGGASKAGAAAAAAAAAQKAAAEAAAKAAAEAAAKAATKAVGEGLGAIAKDALQLGGEVAKKVSKLDLGKIFDKADLPKIAGTGGLGEKLKEIIKEKGAKIKIDPEKCTCHCPGGLKPEPGSMTKMFPEGGIQPPKPEFPGPAQTLRFPEGGIQPPKPSDPGTIQTLRHPEGGHQLPKPSDPGTIQTLRHPEGGHQLPKPGDLGTPQTLRHPEGGIQEAPTHRVEL